MRPQQRKPGYAPRLESPGHICRYLTTIKARHLRPRRENAAYFALIDNFRKAIQKEFERQAQATTRFLARQNAYEELYRYAKKEHPEAYEEKPKDKLTTDNQKAVVNKSKADDIKKINEYFKGWEKYVKPENMARVIKYYAEKAANLGGRSALKTMGVKMEFNLRDPKMLLQIEDRGKEIAGFVNGNTLDDFKDTLVESYMEDGATPYEARKAIKELVEDEETYANRAMTIARTETGASQMAIEMETFKQNGVGRKRWIATMDARTRASHEDMNNEEVDIDEPFSNGLMFPMDPEGPPEEVINCRCDMIALDIPDNICEGTDEDQANCKIPWTGGQSEAQMRAAVRDAEANPGRYAGADLGE